MVFMSPTVQRYVLSSIVTFLATFFLVFGTNLEMSGSVAVSGSLIAGIALTALRAAVKAVIEGFVGKTGDVTP